MEPGGEQPVSMGRQRLDKWLFFARLAKSRAIAQRWIAEDLVRVNGQPVQQASHGLKRGDRVEILTWRGLERSARTVIMLLPGERRGPYEEARHLYEDLGSADLAD